LSDGYVEWTKAISGLQEERGPRTACLMRMVNDDDGRIEEELMLRNVNALSGRKRG